MGIWRVTGSIWLQNLAMINIVVFNTTPGGNKLVGIQNRMGMKFASKFNGTSRQHPEGWCPPPTVVQASSLHSISIKCTFNLVHMSLVSIQLVRLSLVVSDAGPL
eukprot:1023122-Pelagomonas_calceolata.AAC.3